MKIHTQDFKDKIKELGRELDNKITYELNSETIELGNEELNSITPHYEGALLKSIMKQLDIDSNVDIPLETEVNYQLGLKTRSGKNICSGITSHKSVNQTTGAITTQTGDNTNKYLSIEDKANVKPNTTYTIKFYDISFNPTCLYGTYDNNGDFIERLSTSSTNGLITFTTGNNVYSVFIYLYDGNSRLTNNETEVMLNEGGTPLPYEPYGTHEYLDYGNYIVYSSEKQEDTNSYKIIAYDKMLYSMKPYEALTDTLGDTITYPITLRDYLIALARRLNLTFKNASDTFVNYDKEIKSERYLTEDGESLNYTYRDVLDELSQATASSICISDDDELEVRYITQTIGKNILDSISSYTFRADTIETKLLGTIDLVANTTYYISYNIENDTTSNTRNTPRLTFNDTNFYQYTTPNQNLTAGRKVWEFTPTASGTYDLKYWVHTLSNDVTISDFMVSTSSDITYEPYGDTIDEEYLKDVNVKFGEKFGPINALTLARSADSDIIDRTDDESIQENGLCEIRISDNQILNDDDRDLFIDGIFNQLKGLEYYVNDYSSTGICYYDFLDRYNVKVDDKFYSCLMLSDEIEVSQGLIENIHAEAMEQHETDYTKSSKTDKLERRTGIIVDKQNGTIDLFVERVNTLETDYDDLDDRVNDLGTRMSIAESGVQIAVSVQQQLDTGVELVKTGIVTIDENGIDVGNTSSKVHTKMTNNEFSVGSENSSEKFCFIGYDGNASKGEIDNLYVRHWLSAGVHRTEKFEVNGETRTGVFYEGSRQ